MLKTYALFDLIGMQAALEKGEAAKVLREFWAAVENWTNHLAKDVGSVTFEDGGTGTPMPRVVTFSDSAVLWHEPEVVLPSFYTLVRRLKETVDRECPSYVVVCRGEEIVPKEMTISVLSGGDPRPLYQNVLGSGQVVQELFSAEKFVRKQKDWHDGGLSLYCVGDRSKSDGEPKDNRKAPGLNDPILALS